MVSSVGSTTLLHDATLLIRDLIASGVTDSITRVGNEKFVMTSYPERPVKWPIITVKGNRTTEFLGMYSESQGVNLDFEVRIWASNALQKDGLAGSVYEALREHQTGISPYSGTEPYGLVNFSLISEVDVDETNEEGKSGVRSKVQNYRYFYVI